MTQSPLSVIKRLVTIIFLFGLSSCHDDKNPPVTNFSLPDIENKAPIANNVAIILPTQPGSDISGKYDYSDDWDAEGKSLYSWLIDDVLIAQNLHFTLPNDSEGKKLSFCVIPIAKTGVTLGIKRCIHTLIRGQYKKPSIEGLTLPSSITTDIAISANYTFIDNHSRVEGESVYSWKINDTEVASGKNITIDKKFQDSQLMLCITPVANLGNNSVGEETCSEEILIGAKVGTAPSIQNLELVNFAKAGNTLSLSYDFIDDDGDLAAPHSFTWAIDGTIFGQTEHFTLPNGSDGKLLRVCISPSAQTGIPAQGNPVCIDKVIADIVITGELELLKTIELTIKGYTYNGVTWRITHPDYPYIRSFDTSSFTITGLTPTEDAIWLIGYDVEVCVDTVESGEICLLASEQPEDEITGGLPTALDVNNNIIQRVVSPVSFIDLTISGVTKRLHRPLNTTESIMLNSSSGGSVPLHTSQFTDVNTAIVWALHDWQTAKDNCESRDKALPVDGVNDTSDAFGLHQYYNEVVNNFNHFPYSHFVRALGWPGKYYRTSSLYSVGNHYDYYLITGADSWVADTTAEVASCLTSLR